MLEPGHFTSLATGLFCLIRLVRRLALSWRIRWCSLQVVLGIERGCAAYFEKQPHNCYIAIISTTGELVYSAIERLNTLTRDSQDQAWKKKSRTNPFKNQAFFSPEPMTTLSHAKDDGGWRLIARTISAHGLVWKSPYSGIESASSFMKMGLFWFIKNRNRQKLARTVYLICRNVNVTGLGGSIFVYSVIGPSVKKRWVPGSPC